jgi:thiol-disulfide isomerase/thioredoxin
MIVKNNEQPGNSKSVMPAQLVVYGRAECHLCQEMINALQQLQKRLLFNFEIIDIDCDPELKTLYNERVPVLMALYEKQEICHYHLDVAALDTYLARAR